MKANKTAMTLLEILMVVIVIGILAGLGLPNFMKARERALQKEAQANLKLIAAAERIYRMETGEFYDAGTVSAINDVLRLSLPTASANWTYSTSATSSTFTATAGRGGCTYTLDNTSDEPVGGAGCE